MLGIKKEVSKIPVIEETLRSLAKKVDHMGILLEMIEKEGKGEKSKKIQ